MLLVGNAVSLIFVVNDYRLLGLGPLLALCVGFRAFWVVVGAVVWWMLGRERSPERADVALLVWISLVVVGSAVIAGTRDPAFWSFALTLQAIALACYLAIPFRYSFRLFSGWLVVVGYLGAQMVRHAGLDQTVPILLDLVLTNVVGMVAAYQLEWSRRQSYLRLEQVREAKQVADAANLAKSRFLAAASHDLRQPVHALGMFLGALHAHSMDREASRIVDEMEDSVGAMTALFGSLLEISSLDAGVIEPQHETFALAPVLARVAREFEAEASRKGVTIRLRTRAVSVHSDPLLIERVVRNLVSNAVRYTAHGHVVLGVRRIGEHARIYVGDTGYGIAPERAERIFDEFYRADERETGGLGLGLAIVKRLTVLLETPLRFTSQPGRGTLFTLDVELAAEAIAPPVAVRNPAGLDGLVLIVDDDPAICEAMSVLLRSWGLETIAAASGDEMVERVAASQQSPRLIICDSRLQRGERGVDVVRRLQTVLGRPVPAVLISGDTSPDHLREAEASGFVFLHKPVPNAKLRAAIGNAMRAAVSASV